MPHPDPVIPSAVRGSPDDMGGFGSRPANRRTFLRGLLSVAGAGVVGAGSLAALSGCDIFGSEEPAPDPVPPALQGFLTATIELGSRYDATIAAVDSLPATVGQIRDAHRAHARAIAQAIGAPTPQPSSSGGNQSPTGRDEALAALVTAEKAAADDAVAECLASPPRYAALLGTIAAARATHLVGLA